MEKLPEQEMIEWFLGSHSGGRDGKGVAIIYAIETDELKPNHSFESRRNDWLHLNPNGDKYSLAETPSLELWNMYLQGEATYNLDTHKIEPNPVV